MPTQLATPTITLAIEDKTTIRISGLAVAHALGYQVKIGTLSGGQVAQAVSPTDGVVEFASLSPRSIYYVSARATGDDDTYTNSEWSTEQSITTGTDVDPELDIPSISVASESFTTLKVSGLTAYAEYRFQVSPTEAGLADAPIRITGTSNGSMFIRGLDPGTTYFVRFCLVVGTKCSAWSDIVSGTTEAITNRITVSSGDDSGAGTLRQAVSDATSGTKIILDVSTVTLNSIISNTSKRIMIVGGKSARTTIQPGNNNALLSITYLSGRHLRFTGNVGSAAAITNGNYDDCELDALTTSGIGGFVTNTGFSDSLIKNCRAGDYGFRNGNASDTRIIGCASVNGASYGGGASASVLNNCLIQNCSAANLGGGAYSSTLTNCTLDGNSATTGAGANAGTLVRCTLTGNTATNGGGASGATITNSIITGNTATNGGGASGCTLTNCTLTGNSVSSGFGGGAYNCQIYNCLIVKNRKTSDNTDNDITEAQNADTSIYCSTIGVLGFNYAARMFIYNTLYNSWNNTPTGANANNISYADAADSYFIDAANGDYRLKYGAPAINAGDNQYVTTTTDLAGNPRIGNGTVDVGAYEFEPYKLPAPEFEIAVLPGGQATVTYTLPPLASGFCLQYADNDAFLRPHEISSTAIAIDLSGLTGQVYFRAKALGTEGQSLDSDWSETGEGYFDITAPVIIVDQTPIEMVYGQTVDFLADVTITDDTTGDLTVHYQVLDINGDPVEVDGQTTDIRSSGIPKGSYTLHITAADVAGNVGTADRDLAVLPPRLPAPDISLKGIQGTTAIISGLLNSSAIGWMMSVDGEEKSVIPNEGGQVILANLTSNITHLVKAKALGDWIQPADPEPPSGDYRDSNWSATLSITIGGDTPAGTPSIAKSAITDHTLVLAVSGVSEDISYLEILLATNPAFVDPVLVTKVSKPEIVIDGLKASQIYFVRARGYYGAEPTAFSSTLVVETLPIQSTSPADKLAYIRARIALLRDYLAEVGNLSTISIDGISESRVDRASIRAELAELEAEESRLAGGGGRLRTIDARWVI